MTAAFLELALAAADAGGTVLRNKFGCGLDVKSKAPSDLVTEADLNAERVIIDLIRASYPGHAIMAEESRSGTEIAEHLWVIDPLDGTTNFVHSVPNFGVSVAYYNEGRATVGVVHNPILNDWYSAELGQGAVVNDKPARVAQSSLSESLIGVGFYYDRGEMMRATLAAVEELFTQQIHGIRRLGSAALDLCHVGTGQFGAFFEYQLSPWDFAAGRLFVEEAGGLVSTCAGDPLELKVSTVLATSPAIRSHVLKIVQKHMPH